MTDAESDHTITGAHSGITRRLFLGSVASVGGLVLVGCTSDGMFAPDGTSTPGAELRPFLTAAERTIVTAIVARLIPGTLGDPGGVEAGAVDYIDGKLARFSAFAEPSFLAEPYVDVIESGPVPIGDAVLTVSSDQLYRYGYQSGVLPHELYRRGIEAFDGFTVARFGAAFAELGPEEQDRALDVLDRLQQGSQGGENSDQGGENTPGGAGGSGGSGGGPDQEGFTEARSAFGDLNPGEFFSTIREDAIEGMFADPSYGGNRNLVGWALIGYPGYQRAWTPTEMLLGTRRKPQSLENLPTMNPDRHDEHSIPALEQPIDGVKDG
ncbi:gluconate 2-dehydrogenase subunit 3 family protein [Labedella populi]|uniref:Gluconate 2-dehydrogenase subunit 3 family protein n=1 Tax=Labedella populi TaxID=2498850 RepID=A0A3S3ZW91_9MICO|nr:gluconate 2-dehydrogenase subunit 3 family protein [Labedella populi]RWZ68002.1 gluconate 2-dehydrogenase subunit 3 family protein [Labedella populi]